MNTGDKESLGAIFIVETKAIFKYNQSEIMIGRSRNCDLILENPTISRKHAVIRQVDGKFNISDLESTGGTYVNGETITNRALAEGDVITLGTYHLVFGKEEFPVSNSQKKYELPQDAEESNEVTHVHYRAKQNG
jgi:pSer/pThr/pTyr-binding forkhead associated (FHA) protein